MTAREMFKKLGFEQTLNDSDFIFYEKVEAESCHTRFMFALEKEGVEAQSMSSKYMKEKIAK